ncbi:MAG: helix-turn-helix transcriptional regulator [Firmicutes bacterium]|nr:helix-turn-helix transcriptional regulator [Bacillota bacterium]
MNAAELGHVIKEARIAKKMTQSQVVGNFITRNMLSQIENGNALPSLPTLEYLAEVLDLPDILDFSSSSSNENSRELSHISDVAAAIAAAKKAARSCDWNALAAMEDNYPEELSDEFEALLAKAFLALARETLDEPAAAAAYLSKAVAYSDRGLYANATVKAEAVILLQKAASSISVIEQDTL